MVSPRDLPLRRALLERGSEGTSPDPAVVEHKWGLFLELIRWVEGGSCRHDAILRYFGDEAETLAGCGRCDVCLALGAPSGDVDPETATLLVRKALSGAARVHNKFGLAARGQAGPRRSGSAPRARRAHARSDVGQPARLPRGVAPRAPAPLRHRGLGELQRRRPAGGGADRGRARGDEGRAAGQSPAPAARAAPRHRAGRDAARGITRTGPARRPARAIVGRDGRGGRRAVRGPPPSPAHGGARRGHRALHRRERSDPPRRGGAPAARPRGAAARARHRPPQGGALRRRAFSRWWPPRPRGAVADEQCGPAAGRGRARGHRQEVRRLRRAARRDARHRAG